MVIQGGVELRLALNAMAAREDRATRLAVRELAARLIRYAKREASGPARGGGVRRNRKGEVVPHHSGGPGVVTGHLRRSILVLNEGRQGPFSWFTRVAPRTPYARRLELGFVGADSRGRRYTQPPYPYMRPALRKVDAEANKVFVRVWRKAEEG